ncbi:hypothetical protein ACE1B6_13415 [Aerosakkonemataceae cyanobacterium BLCC-F154]|uniref:Uncharacterized protein n=1 Tax=Floridaenema fluviatile BLCC-F154 TaxID=3153640 RepID=A0ABV4YBR4_9CYAN
MFGFIKNILSSDKSDSTAPKAKKQKGYFLELDDSATPQTTNGSKPAETAKAEPAPEAKAEPAKAESEVVVIEPTPAETKAEPAPAETKPEPAAAETKAETAPAETKAEPAKVETKSTKTRAKKAKPAPTPKPEAKPEAAPTPAPVAATPPKAQTEPDKTFAPKYLMSTGNNGRRRPGANMSSFLEMARQVKTSK